MVHTIAGTGAAINKCKILPSLKVPAHQAMEVAPSGCGKHVIGNPPIGRLEIMYKEPFVSVRPRG